MSSVDSVGNSIFYAHAMPTQKADTSISLKIASQAIPHQTLMANIEGIKGKVSTNPSYTLSQAEQAQVKEAFVRCNQLFSGDLLKKLSQLPPDAVKTAIFSALEEGDESKIQDSLRCFLKALADTNLAYLADLNPERMNDILKSNALISDRALKSVLHTKGKAIGRELKYQISYFTHHLIRMFISLTGLTEIGGGKATQWDSGEMKSYEAKAKLEFYIILLAAPSILFASLFAILGSAAAAITVTGIAIAGCLLMIPVYQRYLRPCPNSYMGLENLNQKILRSNEPPIFQRTDILNRIQSAFRAGKGVVLTGDAGTGKTSIADSLAGLIVSQQAAAFLHKAQMFSTNANQFKSSGYDNLSFNSIGEHFQDHSKDVIFFIDEIAGLFGGGDRKGNPAKSLLTFADKYRYILCATTNAEYEKMKRREEDFTPFNRRFVHIKIGALKPQELEIALYEHLHYKSPELMLEENVLSYIAEKAAEFNSKTSQVDASISLLASAIDKATYITFETQEKQVDDLKLEIDYLEKHLLHSDQEVSKKVLESYQQKQIALASAKSELSGKLEALNRIRKIEAVCLEIKRQGYQLAAKSLKAASPNPKQWMINHAIHKIFTDFVALKRRQLGLPIGINKALIDSLVAASKEAASVA